MEVSDLKISIIIPVYNAEAFLEKCINSVIIQTHKNLQIILVDDGSLDNSLKICKKFAESDSRIEVYHTENRGSVAARRYGLMKVAGEYIGFIDADDYIEPNMFSELLQAILITDADFVHSGYIEVKGENKRNVYDFKEAVIETSNFQSKIKVLKEYVFNRTGENFITSSIWSKLFKSEFIKKCYMPLNDRQQYGEDLLCLCRCIMESHKITLVKKAMYYYILREQSLSHLKYDEYAMNEVVLWNSIINVLQEYNCIKFLKENFYYFLKKSMINVVLEDSERKMPIPQFYFQDITLLTGKKIVIFGAGKVGRDYYDQISKYRNCEIVAWVDSRWDEYCFEYADVISIERIFSIHWDEIIIAVWDKKTGIEMINSLLDFGIDKEKINWQEPGRYY